MQRGFHERGEYIGKVDLVAWVISAMDDATSLKATHSARSRWHKRPLIAAPEVLVGAIPIEIPQ